MDIYESYFLTPSGKRMPGIKYYELEETAKQIVDLYLEKDDNLKQSFDSFKKDYIHYSPYIDFLICKLNYKLINPFITEEGYLYGKDEKIIYVQNAFDDKYRKTLEYPKASDKDLHIERVNIDNIEDSIIDPNGNCYILNRESSEFHQQYFETILLHKMAKNKELYEDYIKCIKEYNDIFYLINVYFRDRLGYLQVVKYPNGSGHILYNDQLKDDYITNLLSSIKDFYPNISLEKSIIPEELIDSSIEIKNEMSDIHESRRI